MKGKKILSAIIAGAMVLCTMSFSVFAEGEATNVTVPTPTYEWYNGNTDGNYVIKSLSDYLGFVNITKGTADGITKDYFQGKTLTLNCDIDFNGIDFLYVDADGTITSDWRAYYFNGTFDGNDKTIKNVKYTILKQDNDSNYGLGVIRNSENGTFKKITVDGVTVVSNSRISFGGLVVGTGKINNIGCTFEGCNVKNIDVDVNTENGFNSYIGGLAGRIIDASVVKNCSVENFDLYTANGVNQVGGLSGWWYISNSDQEIGEVSDTTVKNFKANVAALGGHNEGASGNFGGIGGMLGYGHGGNDWWPLPITNCHVAGLDLNVNNAENHSYIGGFVGTSRRKYAAENCSAQGKIMASNKEGANVFAGGFAGGANGVDTEQMNGWSYDEKAATYTNCTAVVDIVATGTVYAGGFAGIAGSSFTANSTYHEGLNVEFTGCTANGTITADGVAGGFAGNANRGVFTECDASETTVSGSVSGGFIGSLGKVLSVTAGGTYVADIKQCTGSATAADFLGETNNTITTKVAVATINDNAYYYDFAEAVAAAQNGDTVTLLNNASGNGVKIPSGSNITIDFNGFTYNIDGTTVGSSGTETNGFQLLKNSNITFKNGTITSDKAKILIQNYSNLTLENMTLDGSNLPGSNRYVLSNNCGNTVLKGNTNIIAKEDDVAFDCYYWPSNGYTEGVTVTLGEDFTGKIDGAIEKTHDNSVTDEDAASKQSISISGGTFTTDVSAYCTDGFSPKLVNGVYVVDNAAGVITVNFKQRDDDKNSYDIVLKGDGEGIYEFVSAELQFVNNSKNLSGEPMKYEITGTDDVNVIANTTNGDRYGFYLKDGAVSNRLSGSEVIIGMITFPAQGNRDFEVKAEDSTVITTLQGTHLETTYTETGISKLEAGAPINDEVAAATRNVAINVDFAHKLDNTGWNGNHQITVTLKDAFGNIVGDNAYPLAIANNAGTYTFADVPVGRITVTLKAPGFRTFTYTTTVEEGTDPLVLSFWNDTKRDTTAEVEPGKAMINNFVVGDIAMDYIVDKYDLAAVTSYYGTYGLTDVNKIKYDLNRDGNIDITDVAYVLHNFGF